MKKKIEQVNSLSHHTNTQGNLTPTLDLLFHRYCCAYGVWYARRIAAYVHVCMASTSVATIVAIFSWDEQVSTV
jgi:hypothetical protein